MGSGHGLQIRAIGQTIGQSHRANPRHRARNPMEAKKLFLEKVHKKLVYDI